MTAPIMDTTASPAAAKTTETLGETPTAKAIETPAAKPSEEPAAKPSEEPAAKPANSDTPSANVTSTAPSEDTGIMEDIGAAAANTTQSLQEPPALTNLPNSAFLSYARSAGVAEDIPGNVTPVPPPGAPLVPTFQSMWAQLPNVSTAQVRSEITTPNTDEKKLRQTFKTLNLSRMTGKHEWNCLPVENMSFSFFVERIRPSMKTDMLRFRELVCADRSSALDAWSQFVESRVWWAVPNTLACDRTFCRDSFEAYYLDAMDACLRSPTETAVADAPIFKDDLLGRWWNKFAHRPHFLFEEYCRRNMQLLVPYDSHESAHYPKEELAKEFAAVPQWMRDLNIPAGIPIPLPPVAYYFHSGLMDDANEQRTLKLDRFLKIEYCALVIAFWWNEMFQGGRQFVIPAATVEVLGVICGSIPIVAGIPTTDILNMMNGLRVRDCTYWNTLVAGLEGIPDSKYIDCIPGTNEYAPDARGGATVLAAARSRRLRLVLRHHNRMQRRKASPLSLKLQVADLLQISGLDEYVKKMRWLSVDEVSVKTLLARLFSKLQTDSAKLSETRKLLRKAEFERDGYRAAVIDDNEQPRRNQGHLPNNFSSAPSQVPNYYSPPSRDNYHSGARRDLEDEDRRREEHSKNVLPPPRQVLPPPRFPFDQPRPRVPVSSPPRAPPYYEGEPNDNWHRTGKRSYTQYGEGQERCRCFQYERYRDSRTCEVHGGNGSIPRRPPSPRPWGHGNSVQTPLPSYNDPYNPSPPRDGGRHHNVHHASHPGNSPGRGYYRNHRYLGR